MTRPSYSGAAAVLLALAAPNLAQAETAGLGSLQVRVRATSILPDEDASIRPVAGSVDIEDVIIPELDISYFFTDHIATELVLLISSHDVDATLAGVGKVNLGEVNLLPPTLLLQYHFRPHATFRPYAGAGVNYTVFWDEDAPGGAVTGIDYDNAVGYALQAGFDYGLDKHWMLNVDVKRYWLNTDVNINSALGSLNADVDIDPWTVSFGVGYRF
jgi:outer membrane protein